MIRVFTHRAFDFNAKSTATTLNVFSLCVFATLNDQKTLSFK
jgi:hypothetical protein